MGRTMTARAVVQRIKELGGYHVRTKGSHATYEATKVDSQGRVVATAKTVVAMHSRDVPIGTLSAIERQLAPVFGEGWLI
ncbi:type II toxin-antitoxin system HicA family toxin [Catellatospora sp. KI3]|uniref:type II toxin-antitoxin system HicA family toxin n=1 Tax=Catellatospora sp. KI3 TaxID=3041620 RepID=UPI0024830857|nr:type II toxin-antitoxin system HicA family toxin [Catellatospora sp. KI3]MDI1460210.1 type II toxin-antitoxin system HicA family toxin [Catellatospora sp. KI3]